MQTKDAFAEYYSAKSRMLVYIPGLADGADAFACMDLSLFYRDALKLTFYHVQAQQHSFDPCSVHNMGHCIN